MVTVMSSLNIRVEQRTGRDDGLGRSGGFGQGARQEGFLRRWGPFICRKGGRWLVFLECIMIGNQAKERLIRFQDMMSRLIKALLMVIGGVTVMFFVLYLMATHSGSGKGSESASTSAQTPLSGQASSQRVPATGVEPDVLSLSGESVASSLLQTDPVASADRESPATVTGPATVVAQEVPVASAEPTGTEIQDSLASEPNPVDELLASARFRTLEEGLSQERQQLARWLAENKLAVMKNLGYWLDQGDYRELYRRASYFHDTLDPDVARLEQFAARRLVEMNRQAAEAEAYRQRQATRLAALKRKLGEEKAEEAFEAERREQEKLAGQVRQRRDAQVAEWARVALEPLVRRDCGPAGEAYRGYQWYQDPRSPSCKRGKGLFFYIGYAPGRPVRLMMRLQEKDSLPVHEFQVEVDRKAFTFTPVSFEEMFPEVIGTPIAYETPAHEQAVEMALALVDARKAYVKLRDGRRDPSLRPLYSNREVSREEREAIDLVLSIYASLDEP